MFISIPINAYLSLLWSRIELLQKYYNVTLLEHNKRFRYLPNNSITDPIRQLITDQMTKTTNEEIHNPWIFMGWSRGVAKKSENIRSSFTSAKVLVDSPGDAIEKNWTMLTCNVTVNFFSDKLYILELIETDMIVTMQKLTSFYYDVDFFNTGEYARFSASISNFSLDNFQANLDVSDNVHQLTLTADLTFIVMGPDAIYRKVILDPTLRVWRWHPDAPKDDEPEDIFEIISLKNSEIM